MAPSNLLNSPFQTSVEPFVDRRHAETAHKHFQRRPVSKPESSDPNHAESEDHLVVHRASSGHFRLSPLLGAGLAVLETIL